MRPHRTLNGWSQIRRGPLVVLWKDRRSWWFRLFGYGLAVTDHADDRPLFSERYSGQHGIQARLYVHYGSLCIHPLTPRPTRRRRSRWAG